MTAKKIIVAYDGSPYSERALKQAVEFAGTKETEIFLVTVVEMPHEVYLAGIDPQGMENQWKKDYANNVAAGMKYCEDRGLKSHAVLLDGDPPSEIIKFAQKEAASLIVTGSRGLGGFKRLLLGSVAHKIVTYSDIPVLVTK